MQFSVITALDENNIDQLLELYCNEFWCNTRKRHDVIKMLENTDIVIGIQDGAGKLVGFVRVLTDYVYKATIYDLIVHPDYRGQKLGKLLMDTLIQHKTLKNVQHFDLHCLPEMYPFYEKWDFTTELGELDFMRRFNYQ